MINPYFFVNRFVERSDYMQCISCGKKLTDEDKVCPRCGKNQPLAETDHLTKFPLLKSLSPICLLIGLVLIPLSLTGVVFLVFISIHEKISVLKLILGLINIIFVTIVPFILAIIFKNIK